MIPVANPIPKPATFDADCRKPGLAWLRANRSTKTFPSHWRKFQSDLALGFHNRCGWWAMYIADGHVDHYLSKENHRRHTYSWDNYRYIAGSVNSSKKNLDDKVLDPFDVQPGWFEVKIPSMILVRTAAVPPEYQAKADDTLRLLKLFNGNKVRNNRRNWYEQHRAHGLPLANLASYAPLVAEAIVKWRAGGLPLPVLSKKVYR